MIDQEHRLLHKQIRDYGCYFMSLLFIASRYVKVPETPDAINKFRQQLLDNGMVDILSDMTVKDPCFVLRSLGLEAEQVKNTDDSVSLPPTVEILGADEILCYTWPEKNYIHFAVGDGHGRLVYDPIHRGANTIRKGKLTSKRLFIIRKP